MGQQASITSNRSGKMKPLDAIFEHPATFDPKGRVNNCAGFQAGSVEQEIRIALSPLVAAYARERGWHPAQTFTPLPDGRTEMTVRLGDLPGIRNRVLRCGSQAEVFSPPELRRKSATTSRRRWGTTTTRRSWAARVDMRRFKLCYSHSLCVNSG